MSNGIQISGFGINVDDLDRSAEFYTGALGLQEKAKYDLGEMHEVLVGGEHDTSAILLVKHIEAHREARAGQRLREDRARSPTTSAAPTSGRSREGGSSVSEPRTLEQMGIRMALVRDPDGYLIELIEPLG